MTHDEVQDLLEDYVDERLDRATRAKVDEHLAGCSECRAILDDVAPVDLGGLDSHSWDEASMRRAVRRSMFRTAGNVAVLLIIGWLIALLASALVLQPVLVNRGGRAAAATRATVDLAVMLNPGASIEEYSFASGFLSRTSEVEVLVPTGTAITSLGTVDSRMTLTGFGFGDFGAREAMLVREFGGRSDVLGQLELLGDGTVARVELHFADPLALAEAEALARIPHETIDVRVLWAGFAVDDVTSSSSLGFDAGGVVGYSTCDESPLPDELSGVGSGMGSGSVFLHPSSVERAHRLTVEALNNLAEHPELVTGPGGWDRDSVNAARDHVAQAGSVKTLVVTGPTDELRAFVERAQPDSGAIRDVDFFNWFDPFCGS